MKLRPEVRRFAERMERKLRKHDKKWGDGWRSMYDEDVWQGIEREMKELRESPTIATSREERADECADVANFLMFLAEPRNPSAVVRGRYS